MLNFIWFCLSNWVGVFGKVVILEVSVDGEEDVRNLKMIKKMEERSVVCLVIWFLGFFNRVE